MEKQVLVNESSLIDIADALREKTGPTRWVPSIQTVYPVMKKVSKTSNAISFTEYDGEYPKSASTYQTITIPGAVKIKVTLAYQTESTSYDYVQMCPGLKSAFSSSSSTKLGGTTLKTITTEYDEQDSVTFYFKSDSAKNDYLGYYAEVVGYDANGNYIRESSGELIEDEVLIEEPNIFQPNEMGNGIRNIATDIRCAVITKGTSSFNYANPGTLDLSPYIGTDDTTPFYLTMVLYSGSTTSSEVGVCFLIQYDGAGNIKIKNHSMGGDTGSTTAAVLSGLRMSFSQGILTLSTNTSGYMYVKQTKRFLFY